MTAEFGIYTQNDDGFVASHLYSMEEAESVFASLVAEASPEDRAEASEDMKILYMCPDHEEQPLIGCYDCLAGLEEGSS